METITIGYYFTLPEGVREAFDLQFDAQTLELVGDFPNVMPLWTKLDFQQCFHCTLSTITHPHCPVAMNLVNIVRRFDSILSYEEIHLDVITPERCVSQRTTAQRGISSLMGLVIAASGCPHTVFFKPMARFHLPLANDEETLYRAISMYLLAQYFVKKEGKKPDFELTGLKRIYENIQVVNSAIVNRLRATTETDSSINAIIVLDMYAKTMPYVIEESLEEIRYLYSAYLRDTGEGGSDNQGSGSSLPGE